MLPYNLVLSKVQLSRSQSQVGACRASALPTDPISAAMGSRDRLVGNHDSREGSLKDRLAHKDTAGTCPHAPWAASSDLVS